MWSLFYESINTTDVLQKRLPNTYLQPNRCVLCKSVAEGLNHIFTSCHLTKSLCDKLIRHIDVQFDTRNAKSLCLSLGAMKQTNKKNVICLNAGVALLWTIWLERNSRLFRYVEKSLVNMWEDIGTLVGMWSSRNSMFKDYNQTTISLNYKALLK